MEGWLDVTWVVISGLVVGWVAGYRVGHERGWRLGVQDSEPRTMSE